MEMADILEVIYSEMIPPPPPPPRGQSSNLDNYRVTANNPYSVIILEVHCRRR